MFLFGINVSEKKQTKSNLIANYILSYIYRANSSLCWFIRIYSDFYSNFITNLAGRLIENSWDSTVDLQYQKESKE